MSVSWPSRHLVRVDYDASVITERDLVLEVLEVQDRGLDVESVVWIRVEGQACVQTIQEQLGSLEGVSNVRGSLQERVVMVAYRPLLVTQQEVKEHIGDLGFRSWSSADADLSGWQEVSPDWSARTVTLCVAGMTCSSCSSSIQERVSQMGGVKSIAVALRDGTATVTFDPRLTEAELLRAAIEEMGFEASLQGGAHVCGVFRNIRLIPASVRSQVPSVCLYHLLPRQQAGVALRGAWRALSSWIPGQKRLADLVITV